MANKDYLEFITGRETPPAFLKEVARRDVLLSFKKNAIIFKFISYQFLGALFSLAVCPQFGLGLAEGHGIAHVFRMMGDVACAAFCGSLFLASGVVLSFIGMKGEELWWVWRRYNLSFIFLPALMWGLLMFTNVSFNLQGETLGYHVTWLITAVVAQVLLMNFRNFLFSRFALVRFHR